MRSMHKLRIGIYGATGYAGLELVQLLARHPHAELRFLASEQKAGVSFGSAYGATGHPSVDSSRFVAYAEAERLLTSGVDTVFLATPAEASRKLARKALEGGARVIDLSGAFRLQDEAAAQAHYGLPAEPALYGLPEWNREQVSSARMIANPGCYATAMSFGLAPFVSSALLASDRVFVSAVSGTSGAGRKAHEDYSFGQIAGDLRAYRSLQHQHVPEVEQFLQTLAPGAPKIAFVPQLGPFDRGILATCFFEVRTGVRTDDLRECLIETYGRELFVSIAPSPDAVRLHHVVGTASVEMGVAVDPRAGQAVVIVALDNLLKGAAGQAVQNFNLMNGFEEGLSLKGLRRTYS
jgi:N-acetyl-gamma-glutamyl-phosphate reductase